MYEWLKKREKKVVCVEVEGIGEEVIGRGNEEGEEVGKENGKGRSGDKGRIMVRIRSGEGLWIEKKGLEYEGVKRVVEKVEGLW